MSATAVHPAFSPTEQSLPKPPTDLPPAPQWLNDLMDAAAAGETEFRKEVRAQIKAGRGEELIATIEGMLTRMTGEAQKATAKLLELVRKWVDEPDELEEGGRFWGAPGYYGGLFGSSFGCGYYPYHCGPVYGGCGWGGCFPPIYAPAFGGIGCYDLW
jgi:hypothetical protein